MGGYPLLDLSQAAVQSNFPPIQVQTTYIPFPNKRFE